MFKNAPQHLSLKTLKIQNNERILKAPSERNQVAYKGRPLRIAPNFSTETLKVRRSWIDVLWTLSHHKCQPRLLYPRNKRLQSFYYIQKKTIIVDEKKILHDITKLKEHLCTNSVLQMVLERNFNLKKLTTPKKI